MHLQLCQTGAYPRLPAQARKSCPANLPRLAKASDASLPREILIQESDISVGGIGIRRTVIISDESALLPTSLVVYHSSMYVYIMYCTSLYNSMNMLLMFII